MKKVSVLIASLAIFAVSSCKEKQEETTKVIEKETVIIEKEATPASTEEKNDGTSINVSKDGVEFSTKNGDKKTEIEVKDGSGSIKVEK